MTKFSKRLYVCLLVVALIASIMTVSVSADFSGTDGSVSWSVDSSEQLLTISGSGSMAQYTNGNAPWYAYKSYIKNIVVKDGVTISKGAFYGLELVDSITVPEIGGGSTNKYFAYIFGAYDYYNGDIYVPSSLKSVTISSDTVIEAYAFNGLSNIKYIYLPQAQTIEGYAFKDCTALKNVAFGDTLATVGSNAFLRCTELDNVFYDGTQEAWSKLSVDSTNSITPVCQSGSTLSVTSPAKTHYVYGEQLNLSGMGVTFNGADVTSDVEVVYPDMSTVGTKTVTVIYGAKRASFNISVTAPESSGFSGVLEWSINNSGELNISGNGMMDNFNLEILPEWYPYRNSITSVIVNEGVTSVGAYAFYGLDNLQTVAIAQSVETVGYAAFEGCTSLSSLTLGNTDTVVDGTALRNCTALIVSNGNAKYFSVNGNNTYALAFVDKTATSFEIPTTTVVIADGAFDGCSLIASVIVPDSVVSIGDQAFASCESLASVTLGSGIKRIGNYAFVGCTSLSDITFASVPDFVGAGAFSETAIVGTVEDGAVYLGTSDNEYAILWKAENNSITDCDVNSNTEIIASLAFANCNLLETVQLPSGLKHIGDSAFNSCSNLYDIQLPDGLITVGDMAFKGCSALMEAVFPSTLKTIGNSAFRGTALSDSVVLDANIENVGYNAFRDCVSLEKAIINTKSVGYKTFAGCSSLNDVYLADTVVSVGDYAFMGCESLGAISIPDTIKSVGYGVLLGCESIEDVALAFIGSHSYDNNNSLSYIFGGDVPEHLNTLLVGYSIQSNAFEGVSSISTLIFDTTLISVAQNALSETVVSKAYYLGTSEDWDNVHVGIGNSLSNVKFAGSAYILESDCIGASAGDVLTRDRFTAKITDGSDSADVTSILRLVNNPITSDDVSLPAKIGSLIELFPVRMTYVAEITDYSLLLEGSIGMKFYITLNEYAQANKEKISATFTYKNTDYPTEIFETKAKDGTVSYYTKFYVAAKEMQSPITLTLSTPVSDVVLTRCVRDYVDYVNVNADKYASCLNLINEMYNYGEYSRNYFDKAGITPPTDLSETTVDISDEYTPTSVGQISGIQLFGTSLLLESKTSIRHYFELEEGKTIEDYTFKVNGISVTPVEKGGMYFVEIANIIAVDLGKLYTTVVTDGTDTISYSYAPLSYAKRIIENQSETNPDLANLSKALYNYYVAAYDYFRDSIQDIIPDEDESEPSIW